MRLTPTNNFLSLTQEARRCVIHPGFELSDLCVTHAFAPDGAFEPTELALPLIRYVGSFMHSGVMNERRSQAAQRKADAPYEVLVELP
jgi:hypothetical protein